MSLPTWTYKGKPITCIEDCPKDAIGFCYCITFIPDSRIYIGKKILYNNKRTIISKRAKKLKPTRKKYNSVTIESDWKSYWGSNLEIKELMKTTKPTDWSREIIMFCYSKREMSYQETKLQFLFEVLETNSFNGTILGKFYKGNLK